MKTKIEKNKNKLDKVTQSVLIFSLNALKNYKVSSYLVSWWLQGVQKGKKSLHVCPGTHDSLLAWRVSSVMTGSDLDDSLMSRRSSNGGLLSPEVDLPRTDGVSGRGGLRGGRVWVWVCS